MPESKNAHRDTRRNAQFLALLSAAVTVAGVMISAANIGVAFITKSTDMNIAARKDFREFVVAHQAAIYGDEGLKTAARFKHIMQATYPKDLLATALPEIGAAIPDKNIQELYPSNSVQSLTISGRVDTAFGGPNDSSVAPDEGLALIDYSDLKKFSQYFLPEQPPGTSGLARRLNPSSFYIAARWNYADTPKSFLRTHLVTVTNPRNGKSAQAQPIDWGPNIQTGRIASISPGVANQIGVHTDDEVTLKIPKPTE